MPKMKTNSSAKKRFTVTGSGKVKRKRAFKSHILTKKAHDRKKALGKAAYVHDANMKQMRKLILI